MKRIYISLLLALMALPMLAQEIDLKVKSDMRQYQYVYVIPSGESFSRGSSSAVAIGNVAVGGGTSTTVSTTDIIAGEAMEKGYIRLPELDSNVADQTLVISYTVSAAYEGIIGGEATVLIQVTDGKTHKMLCSGKSTRQSNSYNTAVSGALRQAIKAILRIPECATPEESATLSEALSGTHTVPNFWPCVSYSSLERIVMKWVNNNSRTPAPVDGVEQSYLPTIIETSYYEAMLELFKNPSSENANTAEAISDFIAKLTPGKKADNIAKKLLKKRTAEDRIDYLKFWAMN